MGVKVGRFHQDAGEDARLQSEAMKERIDDEVAIAFVRPTTADQLQYAHTTCVSIAPFEARRSRCEEDVA